MSELIAFKLISVFISFGFIALAWFSKKIISSWLNPASIFCLFWFLYTFLPLLLAYETPVNPLVVMYIFIFCALFSFSTILFNWKTAFILNENKQPASVVFGNHLFAFSFFVVSLTTILFFVIGMMIQGFSLQQMLNPIRLAGEFASMRYSSEVKSNVFSQAGLQGSYITVVLGGLYYGALKAGGKKKLLVILLSFFPSLLAMTLQSAKGLFFYSIFVFYAGVLVAAIYDKNYQLLTMSTVKKFGIFALFAFPLLISSFLARGLQDAPIQVIVERVKLYLISYSSAHLYAFSDWFSERYFDISSLKYNQETLSGGFYTFMSFFRLAGDSREIPMGVYDEYFEHGMFVKTNIYTFFRGVITDFSLLGSLVFALFIGLIVNVFYYRLLCSKFNALYIVFFIFFIGLSYQSYIISSLMWATIPFVFIVNIFFIMSIKVFLTKRRLYQE